jgi:hypothetical protein
MALPESRETTRGRHLMDILGAVKGDVAVAWPAPTSDDLALIGAIIVQFSYLDFYLRRAIEVLDHAKMGPGGRRGRTGMTPIGEVERFLRSLDDMTPENQLAFDHIKEMPSVGAMVSSSAASGVHRPNLPASASMRSASR